LTAREIFAILVFQGHLPPRYVMDEMRMYEIGCLMPFLYLASKDSWEQARLMSYVSAQTHSTKKMSVSDIVSFPWEEKTQVHDTAMSNADKRRLEEKAKQLEKQMNRK
jgi:hypothetical protein